MAWSLAKREFVDLVSLWLRATANDFDDAADFEEGGADDVNEPVLKAKEELEALGVEFPTV